MVGVEVQGIAVAVGHIERRGDIPAVAGAIPTEVEVQQTLGVIAVADKGVAAGRRITGRVQDGLALVKAFLDHGFPLGGGVIL